MIDKFKGKLAILILDIDGVLADYEGGLLKFARNNYGLSFNTIDEMKEYLCRYDYEQMKKNYRNSGYKEKLLMISDSIPQNISDIMKKGVMVCMVTSRQKEQFKRVEKDTINWLKKNGIKYDAIFFTGLKYMVALAGKFHGIKSFAIEDSKQQALGLANHGVVVYYLGNAPIAHKNIINSIDLDEVFETLKEVFDDLK